MSALGWVLCGFAHAAGRSLWRPSLASFQLLALDGSQAWSVLSGTQTSDEQEVFTTMFSKGRTNKSTPSPRAQKKPPKPQRGIGHPHSLPLGNFSQMSVGMAGVRPG